MSKSYIGDSSDGENQISVEEGFSKNPASYSTHLKNNFFSESAKDIKGQKLDKYNVSYMLKDIGNRILESREVR